MRLAICEAFGKSPKEIAQMTRHEIAVLGAYLVEREERVNAKFGRGT